MKIYYQWLKKTTCSPRETELAKRIKQLPRLLRKSVYELQNLEVQRICSKKTQSQSNAVYHLKIKLSQTLWKIECLLRFREVLILIQIVLINKDKLLMIEEFNHIEKHKALLLKVINRNKPDQQ